MTTNMVQKMSHLGRKILRSLIDSPSHAKHIMNKKSVQDGLHVSRGKDGKLFWTQFFGVKRKLKTNVSLCRHK